MQSNINQVDGGDDGGDGNSNDDRRQLAARGLSFAGCCHMLEQVHLTPNGDAKLRLLFSDALRREIGGGDMYPLLRLVLPQLDRERTYNLKERKIARIFIEVLGMASASKDAQKLERFNDPAVVQSKSVGDFGAVLHEVLQYRSVTGNNKYKHTIAVANELLDALVQASDHEARKKVFMRLATEFPANEQKWIVRIILKDLKIGLRHERVLSFLHPDAIEMYNHTNDLHKVCTELRNSTIRYVPTIEPFQVFSPMLAKRVDFGECITAMNADSFVMEPKLDGERITCHIKGSNVQFISRNGINYTDMYGPGMASYILSQVTKGMDCILDGEMMVWDNHEYRLREFGLLKNTANAIRAGENSHRWLCYVVWDVVYLGGTGAERLIRDVYKGPGEVSVVMGLPLRVRRQLLLRLVKPLEHRVVIIEQTLVDSPSAKERHNIVMAEVDRQVSNGGEGVILKDVSAHYMCGESSRKTKRWIKLKPDYAGMTTNLDVIILGGFYGTGRRRSGNVSVFLVGVLSRSLDEQAAADAMKPGTSCPVFYSFAKVGTGYNFEELDQMRRELEPHWRTWDSDNIPAHFNGWRPQKSDLKPDVWIDPRHSKMLEIYGFELTYTTLYQTGLTLRFPRCKAIRADKEWYQCISVQELNAIRGSTFNKRAADVALGQKKAMRRASKRLNLMKAAGAGGVVAEYSQAKLDDVEQKQDLFEGKEFCVLPGKYDNIIPIEQLQNGNRTSTKSSTVSKQTVEQFLHSYGGTIVQNPIGGTTNCVIAASDTGFKVANLKKQGLFDIMTLQWIVNCASASRQVAARARDYIFATESTQAALAKEYDCFGDHFTQHISPKEVKELIGEVASSLPSAKSPWQQWMRAMPAEESEAMESRWTFLSHCVVYLDRFSTIRAGASRSSDIISVKTDPSDERPTRMKMLEQQVRLYGGTISSVVDAEVTHIVLKSRDPSRIEHLQPIVRKLRREQSKEPPCVTMEWVDACIEQQSQAPVADYFIPV